MPADYKPADGDIPNLESVITVTEDDLPLHCPLERMRLWDSHPRVYLPIEKTGEEACPYCGTKFRLYREPEV